MVVDSLKAIFNVWFALFICIFFSFKSFLHPITEFQKCALQTVFTISQQEKYLSLRFVLIITSLSLSYSCLPQNVPLFISDAKAYNKLAVAGNPTFDMVIL